MAKQLSPFAALTGAEKQIRWLEYQSIKLPYVQAEELNVSPSTSDQSSSDLTKVQEKTLPISQERLQPPPEVPRTVNEFQKVRHSQYDAVIARMKQAELQAKRYQTFS